MLRKAPRLPPFSLPRALSVVSVSILGGVVASSCLTPDFEFPSSPVVSLGGSGYPAVCGNGLLDEGESAVDCGGPCRGCDVGQACNTDHDCLSAAESDPSSPFCNDIKRCELDCPRDKGDCDSSAANGCEIDFLSNVEHCGACRQECDLRHAVEQCMNGECLIKTDAPNQGCDPDWANCNLRVDDGCEVNITTDELHCGACEDSACSAANGVASCSGGQCLVECNQGFADCDEEARANGCEINVRVNVNHCLECSNRCTTSGEDYSAFCGPSGCDETLCPTGMGDCDGDGECLDSLRSLEHCGQCGASCVVANGSPVCADDGMQSVTCAVGSCDTSDDATWADCDGLYSTGCEVNTASSARRCGGCLPAEGGVGEDCAAMVGENHVTVTNCSGGECAIVGCDTGWVDCDGDFSSGCEVNTLTDEANCGGCVASGGAVCTNKPHATRQCSSGSCEYVCEAGWLDLNKDLYDDNSDGCESRSLEVVGAGVVDFLDTGSNAGAPLVIGHTLQGAPGTERLLLVGVLCRGNSAANCAVTSATYGSTPLTLLDEVFVQDSSAKIFYALDQDLPAPGEYDVTIQRNNDWGSLGAEVIEFTGAEQNMFYAAFANAIDDTNCNSSAGIQVLLEDLPLGSVVYAFGGGASGATAGEAAATLPLVLSASNSGAYIVLGSGYTARDSGDIAAHLNFSACYRSVMVAVGIRPEKDY